MHSIQYKNEIDISWFLFTLQINFGIIIPYFLTLYMFRLSDFNDLFH